MNKILVVGATGHLGRSVVSRLQRSNVQVRALVRRDREHEVGSLFGSSGVEIAFGDLTDGASLAAACRGVSAIVSTATSMQSPHDADSIKSVDELGTLSLIEAAEAASVEHFVYVSFAEIDVDFALQRAKRTVEARLQSSRSMTHTILKPAYFMETWLPGLLAKAAGAPITLFGTGEGRVSWISREDVARYAASAAQAPVRGQNLVAALGGPEALSQLDVLRLLEVDGAPRASVNAVSVAELQHGLSSTKPKEEAFSALMLGAAQGLVIEPTAATGLAFSPLTTVQEYLGRLRAGS